MDLVLEYREIERRVSEIRAEMERVAALPDEELPAADRRDRIMAMSGQIEALEPTARALRDQEIEQLQAAANLSAPVITGSQSEDERVAALRAYLRSGEVRAALELADDAAGGYLAPEPIHATMVEAVRKVSPIINEATVMTLTGKGLEAKLPRKTGVTSGGWVSEKALRPATDAPTFGEQKLTCYEWYANPEATQQSLDVIEGAEQLILGDIADTWAETVNAAFCTGDGSGKPTGIWSTAGLAYYTIKLSGTADALDAAQFLATYFALPAKFLPTAKWYMKPATLAALTGLAWPNLTDTPLVRFNDVSGECSIMGKQVVLVDDAPSIGDGLCPAAFGDMKRGYAVGIHKAISTLRDPFSNKPYVGFYTVGRTGGVPWDPKALLILKSDNA